MCQKEGEAGDHTEKNMNEKTVYPTIYCTTANKIFFTTIQHILNIDELFLKNNLCHTMYDFAIYTVKKHHFKYTGRQKHR